MVMLLRVPHFKNNIDERMKTLNLLRTKVGSRTKSQSIETALQLFFAGQNIRHPAVIIGPMSGNNAP
jgi:hypothetical protein